ncbi:MAG: hypothetical protein ACQEQV_07425 [Fibrobacterota bacterium]
MKMLFLLVLLSALTVQASVSATWETGFLGVLRHRIQFDKAGTWIDYRDDAGQSNLYPLNRFTLRYRLNEEHRFVLVYQPLLLETSRTIDRNITVNETTFPAGTPMAFRYSFPFYRVSWLKRITAADDPLDAAWGLSFQIRNAEISFADADGQTLVTEGDIGPVPALKFYLRRDFSAPWYAGTEIDGMYAPVSYLNGSDEEITGAIIDASVFGGRRLEQFPGEVFLNLRYLAGGAVGTSEDEGAGDGYTKNWLHFLICTAGFSVSLQ